MSFKIEIGFLSLSPGSQVNIMFNYDRFKNYGLKLPFDNEVEKMNGTRVENTSFSDIRAQALRLSPSP